jgi:uncharacterized protein
MQGGKQMKIPKKLEVIVKITERCNINCTYCYMFNKGNDEYKSRPAYMSEETALHLAKFLSEAAQLDEIESLRVIFHGGEPMMMKPERFSKICELLNYWVAPHTSLSLVMQSNAMLISEAWATMLIKFGVGVGVSIDGPPEYHDIDRIGHNGKGTYFEVVRGLRHLQQIHNDGLLPPVGTISVIRPQFDGGKVFEHLVKDLGIKNLSFLLPIDTYDTFDHSEVEGYGNYMRAVYTAWTNLGDSSVRVRFIDDMLGFLTGGRSGARLIREQRQTLPFFVVGSNGDLEPDDSLKPINPEIFGRWNVASISLRQYLEMPEIRKVVNESDSLPAPCASCCWQNDCRGNATRFITRYSRKNGFKQKTFLCNPIKSVYSLIAASALKSGLAKEVLLDSIRAEKVENNNRQTLLDLTKNERVHWLLK